MAFKNPCVDPKRGAMYFSKKLTTSLINSFYFFLVIKITVDCSQYWLVKELSPTNIFNASIVLLENWFRR